MNFSEKRKKILFLILLGIFFFVGIIFKLISEDSLHKNSQLTIGKVIDVSFSNNSYYIDYKYFVNGIEYRGSDPLEEGVLYKHIRKVKVEVDKYYPLEYNSINPKNSKIIIQKKSYSPAQLINKGEKIEAFVEKAMIVSENYVDLRILYEYEGRSFNFRTRLHKDKLPCGLVDSCQGKVISIKVNKFYPELNDLYFESYDRKHLLNDSGFK